MADEDMTPDPKGNPDRLGWGAGTMFYIDDDGNKVRIGAVPEDVKETFKKYGQEPPTGPTTEDLPEPAQDGKSSLLRRMFRR